jgi:predicted regulator of Ras-like GTPase activity (Roadblock/LC7/MglB family)
VAGVPGVRGSLLVASGDGLVVAEHVMDGVDSRAVAALAGSVVARLVRTTEQAAMRAPTFVHLKGATGSLLAAPGPDDLVLVAIVGPEANIGLARLEMLDAVAGLV